MKLYNTRLLTADGNDGGNGFDYSGGDTAIDDQIENIEVPEKVEPPKPTFDAEAMATAVGKGVETALERQERVKQQNQPKPEEKPLTQAEYDRIFKRSVVTKEDMAKLFNAENPEQQAAILQALFDKQAIHAQTLAQYETFQMKNSLEARFNVFYKDQFTPIQMERIAQVEQRLETGFFNKYPDLKEFKPLCKEVVNSMKNENFTPKSADEAWDALATRAYAVLKNIPGFQANGGTGVQPLEKVSSGTTTPRRMTPVSTGGQVGGGINGAKTKNTAETIFG